MNENLQQQSDEVFAVTSVFPDVAAFDEKKRILTVKLDCDVELKFILLPNYPFESPPDHRIIAPAFMTELQRKISERFRQNYEDFKGIPVICQCIADAQNIIDEYQREPASEKAKEDHEIEDKQVEVVKRPKAVNLSGQRFNWISGECLEDRKSVFQAHITNVHKKEDPLEALSQLLENGKIARATHNMYAYVIKLPNGIELSDCEDDGEKGAGPKLLHMLKLMNMENQMIVITRWYGGIHLGPDRFRHICNLAREILVAYRKDHGEEVEKKSKKR
ncbi:unnamed protein product [Bursaphelenchus xylophilus]|uniref:(pine wood nematode) hypothetical protein n=1 Tax=Bursaphelenchus xylophilus TaxID=6326 RepID=A0A1I7SL09_BURXY|nr:unnamed protein product [Bursaphelenchus xylophilus]CAG9129325.1 unnamed protein product [Bursaphelenchus xylophilus]